MREGFPPGVPCWVEVSAPDPPAAADFYGSLFGWEAVDLDGESFVARLDGHEVAGVVAGPPAWNTYIGVEDITAGAARVAEAGGRVLTEPIEVGPAGRLVVCADPAGATFNLWQPGSRLGAELVNAPGTWNWSDLYTPDPEGARAFYAAVFGWVAAGVNFGEYDATMWRLPGYADFLEQFDPGLRQRHSDFGAPEGFSDAVGWLLPGHEAAWAVTFSVADADTSAAKAEDRGGQIVSPPSDMGVVRVAVLRDPQGAQFTVSQFAG